MVCSPHLGALAVRGKGLEQLVGLGGKKARGGRMWTCEECGKTAMGMKGSECCVKILPFMSCGTKLQGIQRRNLVEFQLLSD